MKNVIVNKLHVPRIILEEQPVFKRIQKKCSMLKSQS